MNAVIGEFIKKQFIDVIQWIESSDDVMAWRFPMQDMEIQNGAVLIVRDSQVAIFVDNGVVADVFYAGTYELTTKNIPILTNLKNWDKLFSSPFKSDIYFFSTRQQIDQKWGTQYPITIRDKDFGLIRVRAFGNFSYKVIDPVRFMREILGAREIYTSKEIHNQLRGIILQHLSDVIGNSKIPFVDLASNQNFISEKLRKETLEDFLSLGLNIEKITIQSLSLPEEIQKIFDQKVGLNMISGNLDDLMKFQAAQAIPSISDGLISASGDKSSIVEEGVGLGIGIALSQLFSKNFSATSDNSINGNNLFLLLEGLGRLKDLGILTEEEFSAKKADFLKKIK